MAVLSRCAGVGLLGTCCRTASPKVRRFAKLGILIVHVFSDNITTIVIVSHHGGVAGFVCPFACMSAFLTLYKSAAAWPRLVSPSTQATLSIQQSLPAPNQLSEYTAINPRLRQKPPSAKPFNDGRTTTPPKARGQVPRLLPRPTERNGLPLRRRGRAQVDRRLPKHPVRRSGAHPVRSAGIIVRIGPSMAIIKNWEGLELIFAPL
ncbi:hypothetical protein CC78DRAFT_64449 [Lojkania enalia]|uniref:Uncharacterized protein n=1 Tax=Lojkania enalia TaxID=147567 RepID=A0A9P4N6L8_9PLEO|nr:hypothetical protein CC78DRAFT_64449 [Didymosphaeria enalia]